MTAIAGDGQVTMGDSVIMKTEAVGDCSLEIKNALSATAEFKKHFNKNLQIL